jgi:hypothetical protein
MKLAIMQPYFSPYLGYFQLINSVDTFVVYDDVNFMKQSYINRNSILLNGNCHLFSIPLENAGSNRKINEINLLVKPVKLLKTLEQGYKKAPCFETFFPVVKQILEYEETNLSLFIFHSLEILNNYMGIDTRMLLSSNIEKNNELKGQDKVLEICRILGADHYINAIGGQKLYEASVFKKKGITLSFIKMGSVEYRQFDDIFKPNLSIIDVLMFCPRDKLRYLLLNYILI